MKKKKRKSETRRESDRKKIQQQKKIDAQGEKVNGRQNRAEEEEE